MLQVCSIGGHPLVMLLLWAVLVLFPQHLHSADSNGGTPPELAGESKNVGNAGVKARLSPQGISIVSRFLVGALVDAMGSADLDLKPIPLKLESTEAKASLSEFALHVSLPPSKLETIRTTLKGPSQVQMEISSINIISKAHLSGEVEKQQLEGRVEMKAEEALLRMNVSILRNAHGGPTLRIDQCALQQGASGLKLKVALTEGDSQMAVMENRLRAEGEQMLGVMVCSEVEYLIADRINNRFGLLSNKLPLARLEDQQLVEDLKERMQRRQREASRHPRAPSPSLLLNSFNVSRVESLLLDYTIVADPKVDARLGLEIDSSGEISHRGRGGTPFGPTPFQLPSTTSEESVLQLAVSDFVPNSLMYHGHLSGLFNTRIDPTTRQFGPIMRTSCAGDGSSGTLFCLGDFFPTLRRTHPDRRIALLFSTVQAPVIKFHPPSSGGIKFNLLGKISMFLLPSSPANNSKEVGVADMGIEVGARMKVRLSSTKVRPRIQLDKIKLTTLSPGVLMQKELDDAVLLAREVLQRLVNDLLKGGIPIPVHPLFRLNKPKVKIQERALLLLTNLELNEPLLRQLTAADLQQQQ